MTLTITKSAMNKLIDQLTDLTLLERSAQEDPLNRLLGGLALAHAADIERGDDNEFTVIVVED